MPARRSQKTRAKKTRALLADEPYGVDEGVTQSLLATWTNCRQQARYYLDGWRPNQSTESLEFGSLFHFFLEHLYRKTRLGKIKSHKAAVAAWGDLLKLYMAKVSAGAYGSSLSPQTLELIIAQAEGVWPGYCFMWRKDFTRSVRWEELEGVFDVTVDGFRRRGMRDGLRVAGKVRQLFETKTKGAWDQDNLDRKLAFDFQNLYYLEALNATMADRGKKPVDTVLYNVIRRPQIKPGKDGSLVKYVKRVREDTQTRPSFYYVRREAVYSKKRRAAFRKQLRAKLTDFAAWVRGDERVPTYRNEMACLSKFTCRYLESCAADDGRMRNCKRDGRLFEELEQ